jgi:hypothetical protein
VHRVRPRPHRCAAPSLVSSSYATTTIVACVCVSLPHLSLCLAECNNTTRVSLRRGWI